MTLTRTASRDQIESFYDTFALTVGLRDYLIPNPRHTMITRILKRRLGRDLDILDVGCGAGQLTRRLSRHGHVTGCDISGPAIALARLSDPVPTFIAGRVEDMAGEYDVVCCLDVFEHIPPSERETFLAGLKARMRSDGRMCFTTPLPAFTRSEIDQQADRLQVVDEVCDITEIVQLDWGTGLEPQHYETYDLRKVGAYQYFELAEQQHWDGTGHPWSRSERAVRLTLRLSRRAVELPELITRLRGSHA